MDIKSVLIVDNETGFASQLEQDLERLGYQPTGKVHSAENAFAKIEVQKPDIVLIDIRLRGEIDGIKAAEIVRSKYGIPVVFTIAHLDAGLIEKAKLTTPYGFILKPVQERDLRLTIEMALYAATIDTESRQIRKELELNEEFLNETSLTAKVGGWDVDRTSKIRWTKGTYRIFELPYDYQPELDEIINYFHPEQQSDLLAALKRAWEYGEPYDMELQFTTAKGKNLWTHTICKPQVIDGHTLRLVGTFQDITDRKEAEKALGFSENRYEELVNLLPQVVFETNETGDLTFVNTFAFEQFKYTQSDFENGLNALTMISPGDQERATQNISRIMAGELLGGAEYRMQKKDGTQFPAIVHSSPIMDDGKPCGLRGIIIDITDRKIAEAKLRISEATFRSVVESSPMGIHMYRLESNDRLVFAGANPAADQILGVEHAQFIGKTIEEAFPPLNVTEIPERYRMAARDGIPWNTQQIDYQDDKINGAFEVYAFQMTPGSMAVLFFDITERKQAEEALKNSERRFRQLAENIKEVFWIVAADWSKVFYVSPAFKDIWHIDEKAIYHDADLWLHSIVKEDRIKVEKYMEERRGGDLLENTFPEFRIVQPDGTEKWIFARGFPVFNEDGQIHRIAGIAEDITERKNTQELMVQTEKMMSVGGLAAGMAHEINNPLGAILQSAQNIRRRLSPDLEANRIPAQEAEIDLHRLQTYLEKREIIPNLLRIAESGKKASEIISNMLQFSRRSESTMAPIHLPGLVDNVLELAGKDYDLKKEFDFRNIKISKEFESKLPVVRCTETEIEQVMLNVIKNAAQAMSENSHQDPHLIIRLFEEGTMVRMEFEDNGPGLSEEIRKRVFEPFFTTKPVGEGTGLGLSVSYMIVTNNHNGSMAVESEKGKGCKFIVKLPLGV